MIDTAKRAGRFCRGHATQAIVATAMVASGAFFAGVAGATTATPVGTAATSIKTGLTTHYGSPIPAVVAIFVIGLGIGLVFAWMSKSRKGK